MTVRGSLVWAADKFAEVPLLREFARADASLLLQHVLAASKAQLMAAPEQPLTPDQERAFHQAVSRRLAFEPIQYIVGHQEFYGMSLRVTPAVLIPRPETEVLVEAVVRALRLRAAGTMRSSVSNEPMRIVDVGTGSGAIAIALARELSGAVITAVDLSPAALNIARENAVDQGVAGRIHLQESDLMNALNEAREFDAVVSNPPYVSTAERMELHPQVRDFEPHIALFAGGAGLDVIQSLISAAYLRLRDGGLLAMEFGYGQQSALAALLSAWVQVEFVNDLQGIPRVVLARRPIA